MAEYLVNSGLKHNGQLFEANDIVEGDVLGEAAIARLTRDGVITEYSEEDDQPAPKRRVGRPSNAEVAAQAEAAPAEQTDEAAAAAVADEIDV